MLMMYKNDPFAAATYNNDIPSSYPVPHSHEDDADTADIINEYNKLNSYKDLEDVEPSRILKHFDPHSRESIGYLYRLHMSMNPKTPYAKSIFLYALYRSLDHSQPRFSKLYWMERLLKKFPDVICDYFEILVAGIRTKFLRDKAIFVDTEADKRITLNKILNASFSDIKSKYSDFKPLEEFPPVWTFLTQSVTVKEGHISHITFTNKVKVLELLTNFHYGN